MSLKLHRIVKLFPAMALVCLASVNSAPGQSLQGSVTGAGPAGDRNAAVSATPSPEVAKPPVEFKLGIGDVIHVSVWREPELTETAVVRPDGKISLPLAGEMQVAGKTTSSAESLIRTLLLKYVTDPRVSVSVVEIHSRQVFITGQVQRPGAYPLLDSCSVLQLIASAGGLTPYAHKKRISVLDSSNRPVAGFDYDKAIKGDAPQARMLQPGDTVVVP